MLESTEGSLTIVDINTDTPSYFWKGERLLYVRSIRMYNTGNTNRITMRVDDPTKAQKDTYDDMRAAGIFIGKYKAGE